MTRTLFRYADDSSRSFTTTPHFRRSLAAKYVFLGLSWVAFIIYIPVGLSLVSFPQDPVTKEYNYRGQFGLHTMRTVSQFFTVIAYLCFIGSCYFDFAATASSTLSA